MSNRNARNQLQDGCSLKASDEVHNDAVYDEVDMNGRCESKKETDLNSAYYAAIAEGHLAKESHYETATIITKTAEKNKLLVKLREMRKKVDIAAK